MSSTGSRTPCFAVLGNYGAHNLGDEALLASCLGLLRGRWPGARIHVFSDTPAETARVYGVESSSSVGLLKAKVFARMLLRGELFEQIRTLRQADCLVIGGGELLRTDYGAWGVLSIFDRILLAQLLGTPVLMLGVGAGKLDNTGLPFRILKAGSRRAVILTREAESAAVLAAAGLPGAEAAPDLALLLEPAEPRVELPAGPCIGFSFLSAGAVRRRGLDWMDQKRLVAAGAGLLRTAAGLGATPVLYALNHFSHDDDRVIHREIAAASGLGERVVVLEEELPPAEAQGLFGRMDLVVGMRLHACVLALGAGTPALGIAYDSKVRKVLHSLGQGDCVVPLAEMESAAARLEELWHGRETRREQVRRTVESERRRFHEVFGRAIGKVLPA